MTIGTTPRHPGSEFEAPLTSGGMRLPAWLLIASLPSFAAYVAVAALTMPTESVAALTNYQADSLRPALVAMSLLWTVAFVVGAVGLLLIARLMLSRGGVWARLAGGAAVVGGVLFIGYFVVSLVLTGSEAGVVGDDPLHTVGTLTSVAGAWVLLLGTSAIAVALRRARVLRVGGVVFAVIALVYLLVEIVTWMPVFFGAVPAAAGGGLPPFLVGVLWTALGITLLRRRVSSGV